MIFFFSASSPASSSDLSAVVGKYEYVKPGSGGDKSTRFLTLQKDGTAIFFEKGFVVVVVWKLFFFLIWSKIEKPPPFL